jgi:hypothetical protein
VSNSAHPMRCHYSRGCLLFWGQTQASERTIRGAPSSITNLATAGVVGLNPIVVPNKIKHLACLSRAPLIRRFVRTT